MIGSATWDLREWPPGRRLGKMHCPPGKIRHEGEMLQYPPPTFLVLVDEDAVLKLSDGDTAAH